MKYKIVSKTQVGDTIYTEVLYDFDGKTVQVTIPHFQPGDLQSVITGIENRGASEQRVVEESQKCDCIIPAIELNVEKEIVA